MQICDSMDIADCLQSEDGNGAPADCAFRTWKCRCAPADVTEKCEHEEWINRNVHSPWICANHQHGWGNSDLQIYDSMDIADCLQPEDGNGTPADFRPSDVPPALVRKPKSDMTRSNMDNDENTGKCAHEEWINQKLHSP